MKRFVIVLMLVLFLVPAAQAGKCDTANTIAFQQGWLEKNFIQDGEGFFSFDPLIWNKMTVRTKLGVMSCLLKGYGLKKVWMYYMGQNSVIGWYDGRNYSLD